MGTRHRQAVITKKGELKVQQYGQWDGYPSGQGVGILEFLRSADLKKYQKNLEKLRQVTDEEIKEVNKDKNWQSSYPYLSRDCGSDLHKLIEDGNVPYLSYIDEEEAQSWCEGFYTIDFSKNEFITEFYGVTHTFKLDKLPSDEKYLELFKDDDE